MDGRELELGAQLQLRVEADGRVDDVLVSDRRQTSLNRRQNKIKLIYLVRKSESNLVMPVDHD